MEKPPLGKRPLFWEDLMEEWGEDKHLLPDVEPAVLKEIKPRSINVAILPIGFDSLFQVLVPGVKGVKVINVTQSVTSHHFFFFLEGDIFPVVKEGSEPPRLSATLYHHPAGFIVCRDLRLQENDTAVVHLEKCPNGAKFGEEYGIWAECDQCPIKEKCRKVTEKWNQKKSDQL